MSFLLYAVLLGVFAFGGAVIGDPTFRPDRDPGHWKTTVNIGETKHVEE